MNRLFEIFRARFFPFLSILLMVPLAPAVGQTLPITLDDPGPQAGSQLGNSVVRIEDVNGDGVPDLAVGAPLRAVGGNTDQGRAFVFSGATGTLLLTLDNPTPQAGSFFGYSLSDIGDVNGDAVPDLAVGAPFQNVTGNIDQGQAFVFSGSTGALLFTLNDPTPQAGSLLGVSVAGVEDINGDTVPDIAVGAPEKIAGGNDFQGQAFVFSGANGALLLTLDDPTPQAEANFGVSLEGVGDVNGDTVPDIAVGANGQTVGVNDEQGQAFIFSGASGSLLFTLNDPNPVAGAEFGLTLARLGDVNGDAVPDLAVGAPFQFVNLNFEQGQAFVFSGASGTLLITLDHPNPQNGFFGNSLADAGDFDGDGVPDIVVGAPEQNFGANLAQGQAFVFSSATGTLLRTLDNPNPQSGAQFGNSLVGLGDLDGDSIPDLAVGAPFQHVGANPPSGQAFILSGAPVGTSPLLTLNDPSPVGGQFGQSVAGVGDVNGDNVPDIAVGRFERAYVLSGSNGSTLLTLNNPNPPGGSFGFSLAGVGDVNGDTVPDIAVGAMQQDVGANLDQGQVAIFSGADGSIFLTLNDPTPQVNAQFGFALAGVGDVNADTVPDIAVGAHGQDVGTPINQDQGQVFLFSGANGALLRTLDNPNPLLTSLSFFGRSVAEMADINGDAVPDIAVGAPSQRADGNSGQGQAYVFSGATGALLLTLDDPAPQASAQFGSSLAGVGDINGDTVPDLAVGASLQDVPIGFPNHPNQGQAFVFSGANGSLLQTLDTPNPQVLARFGNSLTGIGDVNGDTVPDIAVAGFGQDAGLNSAVGKVFVFSGITGSLLLTLDDPHPQANAGFGVSLAQSGDINGDTISDLAVGAFQQDVGVGVDVGQVFLFDTTSCNILSPGLEVSNDALNQTFLNWNAIPEGIDPALIRVDVIRGNLSNLTADAHFVHMGTVVCLANNTVEMDVGLPPANPPPGDGFFYLVRSYNQVRNGSYGFANQCARERVVTFGDCP